MSAMTATDARACCVSRLLLCRAPDAARAGSARGAPRLHRLRVVACMGLGAGDIVLTMHSEIGQPTLQDPLERSGVRRMDARCLSPALILHAQLPSGPTAMLASTGPSPGSTAVITIKWSSLTRTPARPSPKAEQKNRTIGSACHAAAAASFRPAASDLATASRSAASAGLVVVRSRRSPGSLSTWWRRGATVWL